jgi:hypothetical protein
VRGLPQFQPICTGLVCKGSPLPFPNGRAAIGSHDRLLRAGQWFALQQQGREWGRGGRRAASVEVGKKHWIQICSGSQRASEAEIEMPLTAAALPRSGTLPGISGHGACLWSAISPPGKCCQFTNLPFILLSVPRRLLTFSVLGSLAESAKKEGERRGIGGEDVREHVCWNQRDQRVGRHRFHIQHARAAKVSEGSR